MSADDTSGPVTPMGLNHLVINVRNLEESHRFWTEMLGFKQVGEVRARPEDVYKRQILARTTSRYGDVYSLDRASSSEMCIRDRIMGRLIIENPQPKHRAHLVRDPQRATSSDGRANNRWRIGILCYGATNRSY